MFRVFPSEDLWLRCRLLKSRRVFFSLSRRCYIPRRGRYILCRRRYSPRRGRKNYGRIKINQLANRITCNRYTKAFGDSL